MALPITLMYAGLFGLFGLYLSARAGMYRGTAKASILYGDPINMELAERVRVHQNFLEYVPMMLILMGLIEANGGSRMFLYIVGDLLILARIAHLIGLKHDNMAHKGRALGAGGTALVTAASGIYALWLGVPAVIASF
jgi:uncharacterized membrane protein YecN with MAPEG domain